MIFGLNAERDPEVQSEVGPMDVTLAEVLAAHPNRRVRRSLASNPACPLYVLWKLVEDPEIEVRRSVALNPVSPPEMLVRLLGEGDYVASIRVASNGNLPEDVLQSMSHNSDENIQEAVGSNSNTPAEVLVRLGASASPYVRRRVAANLSTPLDLVELLALDEHFAVRKGAATNPGLKRGTLAQLAKDSDEGVRRAVGGNPNCPRRIFEKLSQDRSSFVKKAIYENPETPDEVLSTMAEREDNVFTLHREIVEKVPQTIEQFHEYLRREKSDFTETMVLYIAEDKSVPLHWVLGSLLDVDSLPLLPMGVDPRYFAAQDTRTPENELRKLVRSSRAPIRREAAGQLLTETTDQVLIDRVLKDKSVNVLNRVAEVAGENLSPAQWQQLVDNGDEDTARIVRFNPRAAGEVRAFLALSGRGARKDASA